MLGAIDAGGTTFKCAVADKERAIIARHRAPTTTPEETVEACRAFFQDVEATRGARLDRLGLASFGPLDVDPGSSTHGRVLKTPKAGWSNVDLKGMFESALGVRVALDTDVNAALLGELNGGGAAVGARRAAYVTVGTGIGAGFVQDGALIAKPLHPEFGHIRVERHPRDSFPGCCAFHEGCLEGLASARAFEARWGPAERVGADHHAWLIEADYLAQACLAINLFLRPDKIILGGGLMRAPHLIERVRAAYADRVRGYLSETSDDIRSLIISPGYGDDAGLMGALFLSWAAGCPEIAPS